MRATPICRLECSRPRSARTSVQGRVRRLQRRLELLPYYAGHERCASHSIFRARRPTLISTFFGVSFAFFPARNTSETCRTPSRRDGLGTSCADGSGVPLSIIARRAQIRAHILFLARGQSEKLSQVSGSEACPGIHGCAIWAGKTDFEVSQLSFARV